MKKILIFPASQRKSSLNRQLAYYLCSQLQQQFIVEIIEPDDIQFPLFNQDDEQNTVLIDKVKDIHKKFKDADGLIIVSPEYNGSVSPYLKNTMDWVSRLSRILPGQHYSSSPLYYKPVLLACATPGTSGGLLGLQSTRLLFTYLGSLIMPEQISLTFAQEAWNDDGSLIDKKRANDISITLFHFEKIVDSISMVSL